MPSPMCSCRPGATLERTQASPAATRHGAARQPCRADRHADSGIELHRQRRERRSRFHPAEAMERAADQASEFIRWANTTVKQEIHDARVFVINLPTIRGLGQFGGFDFYLEDRSGLGRQTLTQSQDTLLKEAGADSILTSVRVNTLQPAPRLQLSVDRVQAEALGLYVSDIFATIQLMLAPVYANDFLYQGRVLRVLLQADAPYRAGPDSLAHFYLPNANRAMIPLANFVHADWVIAAPALTRYNGYPAVEITGTNASDHSSGEAMVEMQKLVTQRLPHGLGYDWAGQSLQELLSGAQAPMLFALSILVVYLCLAALYESWSIPVAVLMAVPVGLLGSTLAALLRGLPNDVFFKVGLLTIIGLSAKNAILIVEFAVTERRSGKSLHDAVLEAARLRFRPILMTSFAFILGVFPMVISSGAGANARHALGTGVVGGMLSAAVLGVLLIPVCFVALRRLMGDKLDEPGDSAAALPVRPAGKSPRLAGTPELNSTPAAAVPARRAWTARGSHNDKNLDRLAHRLAGARGEPSGLACPPLRTDCRRLGVPVERLGKAAQPAQDHGELHQLGHPFPPRADAPDVRNRILRRPFPASRIHDANLGRRPRSHDDRRNPRSEMGRGGLSREPAWLRGNRVSGAVSLAGNCRCRPGLRGCLVARQDRRAAPRVGLNQPAMESASCDSQSSSPG